jgi:hypothetical protein
VTPPGLLYQIGRFLQLLGMSLLIGSIFLDRGMGPSPRVFAAGVVSFVVGWWVARQHPR